MKTHARLIEEKIYKHIVIMKNISYERYILHLDYIRSHIFRIFMLSPNLTIFSIRTISEINTVIRCIIYHIVSL